MHSPVAGDDGDYAAAARLMYSVYAEASQGGPQVDEYLKRRREENERAIREQEEAEKENKSEKINLAQHFALAQALAEKKEERRKEDRWFKMGWFFGRDGGGLDPLLPDPVWLRPAPFCLCALAATVALVPERLVPSNISKIG